MATAAKTSPLKSDFAFFETAALLSRLAYFVYKYRRTIPQLNSQEKYPYLISEREIRLRLLTYSRKREIKQFHVLSCSYGKEMFQKACKVVVLLIET